MHVYTCLYSVYTLIHIKFFIIFYTEFIHVYPIYTGLYTFIQVYTRLYRFIHVYMKPVIDRGKPIRVTNRLSRLLVRFWEILELRIYFWYRWKNLGSIFHFVLVFWSYYNYIGYYSHLKLI